MTTMAEHELSHLNLQLLRGENPPLTPELLVALEASAPEGPRPPGPGRRVSPQARALREALRGSLQANDLQRGGPFLQQAGEARVAALILSCGHEAPIKALDWGLKATEARRDQTGPDPLMLAPLMLGLQAVASRPPTSTPGEWAVRTVRSLKLTGEDWARISPKPPRWQPDLATLADPCQPRDDAREVAPGSWGELEWLSLHVFDAPGERPQLPMIHPGWKGLLANIAWELARPERPEDRLTYSPFAPATLDALIRLAADVTVTTERTRCIVNESRLRERGAHPDDFRDRRLMDEEGRAKHDLNVARTRGLVTHLMPTFYSLEDGQLRPSDAYTRAGWQLMLSPLWREANDLSALTGHAQGSNLSTPVLLRANGGVLGLHGENAAQARDDLAVAQVLISARAQAREEGNALAQATLSQTLQSLWSLRGTLNPRRSFPAHQALSDTLNEAVNS